MALYRYVSNADRQDGTDRLKLSNGYLVKGGAPLEVSDTERARISGRYVLVLVDAPAQPVSEPPVVADVTPPEPQVADLTQPSPSTPSAPGITPTAPEQG